MTFTNADGADDWKRFLKTGSITDYLNYASNRSKDTEAAKQWGHTDDRTDQTDRHGAECRAGGGV